MKLKDSYFYTLREDAKDEESISGNLLVRSGMIKKVSAGVYMYLPLGLRVHRKIEKIVREEMNKIGAIELMMPSLIMEDIYRKSGRLETFGDSVFTLKDRNDKRYVLGPTHEELFAMAASSKIRSYNVFPINLYQFQNKFRDQPRPRYGLIRVREFIMKDAYTFDKDEAGLAKAYQDVYNAYKKMLDRIGIDYRIVTADTGIMGGDLSEEFQAITDIGEDTLVMCTACDYASNLEIAECITNEKEVHEEEKEKELIHTPNARTIEEVATYLNMEPKDFVKTMLYKIDDKVVACLVKGEHEVNPTKVLKLLAGNNIELLDFDNVEKITGAKVGFAGPIGLDIPIIVDNELKNMKNFIVGANKTDYHYKNVNLKDFKYDYLDDIRNITTFDICPKCGNKLVFKKGIEVANTFKLGTKYADAINFKYLDANNNLQPVLMGSYGFGIGRAIAAIVEQNNDDKGIIWPYNISPYQVAIVIVDINDELQVKKANEIYEQLNELNIDTILDDRDERIGVKFNDIDLIGIPIRITVGSKIKDNIVEFKLRSDDNNMELDLKEVITKITKTIN